MALSALVSTRIYDDAPQAVAFPWVEIGDGQSIPDDTSQATGASDAGVSDFFDLHVWSRYAGKKEVKQIVDVLHGLLHEVSFTIAGRSSASAWIRSVRILRDPDGITRHGIVNVEVIHRS
jgi:hypothetical protein